MRNSRHLQLQPLRSGTAHGPVAGKNHFRWIGAYQLHGGLNLTGHRYYNPTWGRFTQPDPTKQETNPYTYAQCDPVNQSDPTGALTGVEIGGTVGAAAGGLLGGALTAGCVATVVACFAAGAVMGAMGAGVGGALGAQIGGGTRRQVSSAGLLGIASGVIGAFRWW
ncbi:RHS repeat-associated core domain-containing protein [Amycolatopsis arida]|uniref:RHS repeat-associated core domain-containing protein n=1 Tax=Amycolatopsis arida TaxID=587909 RepID=UPI003C7BD170